MLAIVSYCLVLGTLCVCASNMKGKSNRIVIYCRRFSSLYLKLDFYQQHQNILYKLPIEMYSVD